MSIFSNPFDSKLRLRCSCGQHATAAEHEASQSSLSEVSDRSTEALGSRVVEQAVMRAVFPQDEMRRKFLQAVGAPTALAAISSIFPMAFAKEAFAQGGKLEKTNLKVGFIPITCATPIIMADPMGFIKTGPQCRDHQNGGVGCCA